MSREKIKIKDVIESLPKKQQEVLTYLLKPETLNAHSKNRWVFIKYC